MHEDNLAGAQDRVLDAASTTRHARRQRDTVHWVLARRQLVCAASSTSVDGDTPVYGRRVLAPIVIAPLRATLATWPRSSACGHIQRGDRVDRAIHRFFLAARTRKHAAGVQVRHVRRPDNGVCRYVHT